MHKNEVVSREQFSPTCLATIEDFGAHEYFQILVVCEDGDGMFGAFAVVTPMTESENNGKHFAIVNVVVAFSRIGLARPESDGMELTIVLLAEDCRRGEARGVGVQENR